MQTNTINKNKLVNIDDINIDNSLPKEKKIKDFIDQIKNPYCYLCDGITVKISFNEKGKRLEEVIEDYISSKFL